MWKWGMQSGDGSGSRALYLILGVALTLYIGCFLYVSANPGLLFTVDSAEYLRAFDNLLNRGVLYSGNLKKPIVPDYYSWRPPGYPVTLMLTNLLWNDIRAVIVLQILLTLLNGFLLYHLMLALGVATRIRLLITALFLFYPSQIVLTQLLMPAVLLQTLLLGALYSLNAFLETRRARYIWLVNAAIGLALLTKPILVLVWVPHLGYSLWVWLRSRQPAVLVSALIPILCILAWSYRNQVHTGLFHFCSMTAHLQAHMVRRYAGLELPTRGGPWGSERQPGRFSEEQETTYTEFSRVVLASPGRIVVRLLHGGFFFFVDPGRYDLYHFLGLRQKESLGRRSWNASRFANAILKIPPPMMAILALITLANILIAVSLVAMPFARRLPIEMRVFLLLLVFYMAFATVGIGRSRYRLPVMPYLWLSTAVALTSFPPARSEKSRPESLSASSG